MKVQVTSQNWSRKNPATFRYHSENMGVNKGDTTPKIAQYHHRPLDSGVPTPADPSGRGITPSCSGPCRGVSVYAEADRLV